jgi:hypothetical protein
VNEREVTHDELRELLGAYAVDALTEAEHAAVDEHLASCAACRREVADHLETVAMLSSGPGRAPTELWDRIRGDIDGSDAPAPPAPVVDIAGRRQAAETAAASRVRRWQGIAAVAAALALVLGVATAVALTSDDDGQVFAGAKRVELTSQDGQATASLVVLDDGSGIVTSSNLAALPADRTYQLWAIDGDDVESAGVLGQTPELAPFTSGEGTGTFAITVEQVPGASAPTTDPVVSGAVA